MRLFKFIVFFIFALFRGKTTILSVTAILSFCIAIILYYLKGPEAYKIPLDIGMAFLTAGLITAFDSVKGNDALTLMRLFSIDPFKKTAIVIAEFSRNLILKEETLDKMSEGADGEKTFTITEKDIIANLKEIPSLSKVDSFAANKILGLLRSHGINLSEVISAQQAIDSLTSDTHEFGAFICIGLNSNAFSVRMQSDHLEQVIDFKNSSALPSNLKQLKYQAPNNTDLVPKTPLAESCVDLATFLKFQPLSKPYAVSILGGLNSTGTEVIGNHIVSKWQDISEKKISSQRIKACASKSFLMVFRVTAKDNSLIGKFIPNATISEDPINYIAFQK